MYARRKPNSLPQKEITHSFYCRKPIHDVGRLFCVLSDPKIINEFWVMKNPQNILSLLSAPLSIYPNAIDGLIAEVVSRVKSGEKAEMPQSRMIGVSASADAPTANTKQKSVLVIPVFKFISKQDIEDFGIMGTTTIQNLINAANADENIIGVVLHVSGNVGGTVMNTTETARQINADTNKPIVTLIEDLGASSAYYLSAGSKFIFAAGPTTLIGNIGTKSQGLDLSGILEKLGAKSWEFFAKESFDKDLGFAEAMAGKPAKYQDAILAPYAKMFMEDVKAMRPQIKEEATHGMIYVAEDAQKMGLIDAIGSMDDAVAKVVELANLKPITNSNSNSNNMEEVVMSVPITVRGAVKALGGKEVTAPTGASTDTTVALDALKNSSATEITELKGKVTALETEKTTLTGKVTALEADKNTLQGKVTALEADKTALTNENAGLKSSTPGAIRSDARQATLEGQQEEPKNQTQEPVDAKVAAAEAEINAHCSELGLLS